MGVAVYLQVARLERRSMSGRQHVEPFTFGRGKRTQQIRPSDSRQFVGQPVPCPPVQRLRRKWALSQRRRV
jgi:hypothetical protein